MKYRSLTCLIACVIEGKVVNHPSDAAGERAVGSALLVVAGDVNKAKR